jgi:NADPH2:quinone reductase
VRAAVVESFGPAENLRIAELPVPEPKDSQVRIRVQATSVNFADIKARYGQYHGGKQPPFVPGLDVTGIIDAVGHGVRNLAVGQRVIAFPAGGSYAEYVIADEILAFPVPESVPVDVAAASPIVSFTAYALLKGVARLNCGETVLVHAAAGGVGATASQLARLLGAGSVIGTVGSEAKRAAAEAAGADHVLLHSDPDFPEQVLALTQGHGADVILDSLSGGVAERSLRCLAMYGRLVHFGSSSGETATFETRDLHASCRSVLGFSLGTTRRERPELLAPIASEVLQYLADGSLQIRIGARFPLQDAASAQRLVESRQSVGKVIITV